MRTFIEVKFKAFSDGVKASSGNLTDLPVYSLNVSDDHIAIVMKTIHIRAVVVIKLDFGVKQIACIFRVSLYSHGGSSAASIWLIHPHTVNFSVWHQKMFLIDLNIFCLSAKD